MKIIFIRGLPGTGKTIVSEILGKIFSDSEIICVDKFKLQEMKKGKNFEKAQELAYKKALKKLDLLYKKGKEYIILEEIICDKDFYNNLNNFVNKTNLVAYWFRLGRPLNKLLEIESSRKRKIKNDKNDFLRLKKEVEFCKIENEYWIKNDDLSLTIKRILDLIK